ncbi:UbiA prenyltransferase family protein [Candidatus Shapirobacteria bacterium]|nr:UbiA prenyltransferase family protein [Candidatus Shapirobacteria bacterium]
MTKNIKPLFISLRPFQWVKNLAIFAAIIFNGKLFDPFLFGQSVAGFFILCGLSSASYLFNDILDAPHDRQHPLKKHRPIASGELKKDLAARAAVFLVFVSLGAAIFLNQSFFFLSLAFVLLHLTYSLALKKRAIFDILGIAASFSLRVFAGEVLTGYHIPIWLMLSVIFLSLFVATGKRLSELVAQKGKKTRPALFQYQQGLLNFYFSTFANATLLSYSLFTFTAQPVEFNEKVFGLLLANYPQALERKWLMVTIPFVIFGIMRYAQLVYLKQEGEQPEKAFINDRLTLFAVLGWGIIVVFLIYVF